MTVTDSPITPPDFWDRQAPKYARKPIDDPAAYERKLTRMRTLLKPTDRVLEIGCGTGSTALLLAPSVANYIATDTSHSMIDIATAKLGPSAPKNLTFRQAAADAEVEGGPFDVICAFSLLHLVPDIPAVLDRARAMLKPDGLLITKTPCLRSVALPIRWMVRGLEAVNVAPKVHFFTRADLIQYHHDAGFDVDEITYFAKKQTSPFMVACPPSHASAGLRAVPDTR
ncbi:ubiquinone/menaquinone biosynthesis C-methylase UbiE [Rubricella aquisinus]|uniref:Ubiquinone/menaquinone biosynthesis C-methylase UbiE n=1 Tax=Rubricella aquisinus TaxID=2028108 RepID=A0A840WZ91_9RHOB|nr:class I SAM-dependent methyltransferase [Rubricella aquisinus]MBB5514976.1 ubiquinone/menaquinone biosynthesis C-methylase UbiE [Rubricella aquisinus]